MLKIRLKLRHLIAMAVCLAGAAIFSGCEKNKMELEDGMYSGTYTVEYLNDRDNSFSAKMTLELKNGKYTCLGILHDQAEFSGNYLINDDKIIFEIEVWETDYINENGKVLAFDFDTYIVPWGEYKYTFNGKNLKFSKKYGDFGRYEWNLKKK